MYVCMYVCMYVYAIPIAITKLYIQDYVYPKFW